MNLSRTFTAFSLLFLASVTSSSAAETETETKIITTTDFDELLLSKTQLLSMPSLMEKKPEFEQWVEKFERVYESVEEKFERMLVWIKNHEHIHAHNNQSPKPSYTLGHNQFSDMTNDEFQKMNNLGKYSPGVEGIMAAQKKAREERLKKKLVHGLSLHDEENKEEEYPELAEFRYLRKLAKKLDGDVDASSSSNSGDSEEDAGFFDDDDDEDDDSSDSGDTDDKSDTDGLPDSVDWVASGAVTPVKNQASCGSCWAFSATGAIEGASYVKYNELISLSEQNLIDCDTTDHGCSGGLMDAAFKFDESAHGLCSETDYPYLATDGHSCSDTCDKVEHSVVSDYNDIDQGDKHGLIASIVMQPTAVAMQADQLGFQFYSSGVFSDESCGEYGQIDHGVLAVGYGTDEETGKTYFKVKNSWGEDWGEDGYFRLDRESSNDWGTCAILMVMSTPILA